MSWTNNSAKFPTPSFTLSGPSALSGGTDGVSDPNALDETYTYDAWGNMQRQGNYNFLQPFSSNNQISASGYSYDAAGDLLTDGIGDTYAYNAAGRMTASNGSQYVYDALGQMVAKIGGTNPGEIVYFGGRAITFRDPSSGGYTDLIWAGGTLIAWVPGTQTATPVYRLVDNVGTLAMTTDNSGNVTGTNEMTPYGGVLSSNTSDPYPYAGLMTDTNGTNIAQYRNYATAPARWLRPDPYNGSYDLANPQSFNRYMYVNGNPLAFTDPSGLDGLCPPEICGHPTTFVHVFGDIPGIDPITAIIGALLNFYPMIQAIFGLGGPAQFKGNVAASQSGKNVPQSSANLPCDPVHSPCLKVAVRGTIPTVPDPTPSSVGSSIPTAPAKSSPFNQWPLNGNLWPGFTPQDGICSSPMPSSMNNNPAMLSCCRAHDACYTSHNCNASSWLPAFFGPCKICNTKVEICLAGAVF